MTPIRTEPWRAWGVSLIVHAVLLFSLAGVVWRSPPAVWQPSLETRFEGPPPALEAFVPQMNLVEFLSQRGSSASGPQTDDLLESVPLTSGFNPSVAVGALSGAGGSGSGAGAGGLAGVVSEEKKVGFFGSRSSAKSVVFVVDMSGSMENGRFVRAQQELVKSIHQLHVTQSFYVIFFNKQAVPLFFPSPVKDLVPATPVMKRRATRWIVERRTGQGTDPQEALVLALSLQPEVIYFLTDGEFPEKCRQVVQEKNTHGAIIHTIALQSREGVSLLEGIAADNKGTFKFVK